MFHRKVYKASCEHQIEEGSENLDFSSILSHGEGSSPRILHNSCISKTPCNYEP